MKQSLLPVSIILSVLFSTLAGCYDYKYVKIRPKEVIKLNNTYEVQIGSYTYSRGKGKTGTAPIISKSVRHIYKADGTVTELVGQADIVITTNKRRYTFKHPIIASIDKNDILTIAGKNYPQTKIPLKNIQKMELKLFDLCKSFKTTIIKTFTALSVILIVPTIAILVVTI